MSDTHEFDPNAAATADGIFGLPAREDAGVRLLGAPFEATCSYGGGTRHGPRLILEASQQVDLLDAHFGSAWKHGITLDPLDRGTSAEIAALDERAREDGSTRVIQECSVRRTQLVESWTRECLSVGTIPGILGGDHSCPLGAIRAAAEDDSLSILHFDAHHDFRDAYEGVRESHASILRNVLDDCPDVECVVQLGIRDYCEEEVAFAERESGRVWVQYAHEVAERRLRGESFANILEEALAPLGPRVWITFDVDGLDPSLCPGTGTPVPGGLTFDEACFTLKMLADSKRRIVGFDVCEVAGSEWDGNVGARLVYKLCGLATGARTWS